MKYQKALGDPATKSGSDLKILEELFYRNMNFLKEQQKQAGEELKNIKKMKSFLKY